jgi:hypothetical protein
MLLPRPGRSVVAARAPGIGPLPGGRCRLYYEMTEPDGSHALVTELR